MISVIIPLYNKALTIQRTIDTVLSQTYRDIEIIIVDDGSTDGSFEIVRNLKIPRLKVIQQKNSGVSAARNRGIEEAQGEYIALLDADDEWMPDYLETLSQLIHIYPEAAVYATNYLFRDTFGNESPTILRKLQFSKPEGFLHNYFEIASASHPPLWTSAVIVRTEALRSVGGFPEDVRSGEDLLTWAHLAARFKIAYSTKPLAIFNIDGYGMSEKPKRIPAENDIVGRELEKIKRDYNPVGISKYISHWHKMRSSVYMRLGMRRKSIKEAIIGLRFSPLNYKLIAFIAINMMPRRIQPF